MKRNDDEFYYYGDIADEIEHEFLTPAEVMRLLAIGRSSFYALVRSGELPAFRVGKQWRVSREALIAFSKQKQGWASGQMGRYFP